MTTHQLKVLEKFDLLELTAQQQHVERGVILKEADTFTTDDTDIGHVDIHKTKIQLKDQVPVQKSYDHVPKPLLKEIKEKVEDLLSRDWILALESKYSSPVVTLRKKDGALRLCCHYQALNAKTDDTHCPIFKAIQIV